MAFDFSKMLKFSQESISSFASKHPHETFYAFAIDGDMLCFNSEESASATLKSYRDKWEQQHRELSSLDDLNVEEKKQAEWLLRALGKHAGIDLNDQAACLAFVNKHRTRSRENGCKYHTPEGIANLRENTGDWEHQGFATLTSKTGFDNDLYQDHYDAAADSDDGHAPDTDYAKAMTALVEGLVAMDVFVSLKRAPDFKASWVDHDY
jgi:hypothetical protein